MEQDKLKATLWDVFEELRIAGKVRTQTEFAELLGVSRSTVNQALKGRGPSLTRSIVSKAVSLRDRLLKGEAPAVSSHAPVESAEGPDGIFIPRETLTLYESLARTAENLSALVSRLMPGSLSETQGKKSIYPEP